MLNRLSEFFKNSWDLLAFWCVCTFILRPFRIFFTQDDAAYAYQALLYARGDFRLHSDVLATVLPQTILGAGAISFGNLFGIPTLINLNSLTWILFLVILLVLKYWLKTSSLVILGLVGIPYWFQYSLGFLYDLYALLLIVLFLWTWDLYVTKRKRCLSSVLLAILALLLPLQLQSLFAFNVFILSMSVQKKEPMAFLTISAGTLLSAMILWIYPKNILQMAQIHTWLQWKNIHLAEIFRTAIQFCCGLGFFLIPLIPSLRKWTRGAFVLASTFHFGLTLFLWKCPGIILAAGVFFSDYLPRYLAAFLSAAGVWGLVGVRNQFRFRTLNDFMVMGLLLCFTFFYSYRGICDLRYAFILVPLLLWWMKAHLFQFHVETLGSQTWFVSALLLLSLFLNSYLVDTTVARWKAAADLESIGIPIHHISAGYGRDLFALEDRCVRLAYQKLGSPPGFTADLRKHLTLLAPRVYQDEWIAEYLVKPHRFFGIPLSLKSQAQIGQEKDPFKIIPYWQLGFIPHQLALFKNQSFRKSWCFQ